MGPAPTWRCAATSPPPSVDLPRECSVCLNISTALLAASPLATLASCLDVEKKGGVATWGPIFVGSPSNELTGPTWGPIYLLYYLAAFFYGAGVGRLGASAVASAEVACVRVCATVVLPCMQSLGCLQSGPRPLVATSTQNPVPAGLDAPSRLPSCPEREIASIS